MNRPTCNPAIVLVLFSVIALLVCAPVEAADWPRWLGPDQDGTASGNTRLASGSFGLEVAWSRPLGIAYSGIGVADGRAVTFFADGELDWLIAVEVGTGKEIWRYEVGTMFPAIGGSEGGASAMPVIDEGTVYGLDARGSLFAVKLEDGTEVWSVRIDETLGARAPHFGLATTPLVVDDLLFVQVGGDEGRSLVGFDKRSGKVRWSTADDRMGYQSPIVTTLAGRRQIVAMTNERVYGLLPAGGEVLWSHEHGVAEDDGYATPVLLGDDGFLLTGQAESKAFRVTKQDDGYELKELWSTTALKGSLATPVAHEGHLYGFDNEFLTCIDAATGDKVWKSRPPGGRGLILVDGQLIVFANDGSVVAAAASPEGYEETARVAVSESGTYTYPSFADGLIFVRNTRELAAVRVTEATTASIEPGAGSPTASTHAFGRFVRRLEGSPIQRLLIDDFMAAQVGFPIVEDDRWVHFIYRGEADDVAITGSMTEFRVEEALARVPGTDLFHASYAIEPGSRWEYRLNIDFENLGPDPLNPRRIPGDQGDLSEVRTSGWQPPDFVRPYAGKRPGRLESFTLASEILGNEREVDIYLPPGYDEGRGSHPLLVMTNGKDWLDKAHLPNTLNHLIDGVIAPVVVAFVDNVEETARSEFGGDRSGDYVRMLAEELVPRLETSYRLDARPESRAVMGASTGAMMAAYAAAARPDVFGMSAGCSLYWSAPGADEMLAMIEGKEGGERARFWLVRTSYPLRREEWSVDLGRDTDRLADVLKKAGYEVVATEVKGSSGWGGWRVRAGEFLQRMFPL